MVADAAGAVADRLTVSTSQPTHHGHLATGSTRRTLIMVGEVIKKRQKDTQHTDTEREVRIAGKMKNEFDDVVFGDT